MHCPWPLLRQWELLWQPCSDPDEPLCDLSGESARLCRHVQKLLACSTRTVSKYLWCLSLHMHDATACCTVLSTHNHSVDGTARCAANSPCQHHTTTIFCMQKHISHGALSAGCNAVSNRQVDWTTGRCKLTETHAKYGNISMIQAFSQALQISLSLKKRI